MGSRFQFVDDHRDAYEVKRLCEVLNVNRSSYYKWPAGRPQRSGGGPTGSCRARSERSTLSPAAPTAPHG
ncbi:hypothetical protein GCM10022206_58610 [Streptomyces chiangmaiensis]